MPFSSKTIAVTVTYNPDPEIFKIQLESLKNQCDAIIIDNASKSESVKDIEEYCRTNNHVQLISLNENIGISGAQNIGIEKVMQNHPEARFVLLLDHDSVPNDGMVEILENEFRSLHGNGKNIAAIGPLLYDPRDKEYIGFHRIQKGVWKKIIPALHAPPVECHSLNSSGSLISLEAIKKIGLLNKDFFMDHGETEWCFRALNKGYKVYGTPSVTLTHYMGDGVCEYWFLKKRRMPYRSPLRHYYIVRNSIHLQKKGYVPLTWKFWNVFKIAFTFVYFGFFSRESREQRKYILRGIRDGFRGITGEFIPNPITGLG